jgi:hypothetical protein
MCSSSKDQRWLVVGTVKQTLNKGKYCVIEKYSTFNVKIHQHQRDGVSGDLHGL